MKKEVCVSPPNWICKVGESGIVYLEDCVQSSLDTFIKLEKINPKRVRAIRGGKYKHLGIHYWVEANGYVFDCSNNQQIIAPINEYYKEFQFYNIEYTSEGFFNGETYVCKGEIKVYKKN
jgi:hypothetical protein